MSMQTESPLGAGGQQHAAASEPSRGERIPAFGGGVKSSRVGMAQGVQAGDLDIADVLRMMLRTGASDLHLTTGAPPIVRLDGQLAALPGMDVLKPDSLQRSLYSILTQKQREVFEEKLELDFSHALVGEARFRVNLYRQRDSVEIGRAHV